MHVYFIETTNLYAVKKNLESNWLIHGTSNICLGTSATYENVSHPWKQQKYHFAKHKLLWQPQKYVLFDWQSSQFQIFLAIMGNIRSGQLKLLSIHLS